MLRKLFFGLTILDGFSKYLGGPMGDLGDLGELNVLLSASDGTPVFIRESSFKNNRNNHCKHQTLSQ